MFTPGRPLLGEDLALESLVSLMRTLKAFPTGERALSMVFCACGDEVDGDADASC
jgi:hypothetical protein